MDGVDFNLYVHIPCMHLQRVIYFIQLYAKSGLVRLGRNKHQLNRKPLACLMICNGRRDVNLGMLFMNICTGCAVKKAQEICNIYKRDTPSSLCYEH